MIAVSAFGAPQAGNLLELTFARMDKAAATFKGLTAGIRQLSHTEVVDTNDIEEGTIAVKRVKAKDTRILIKFTKPDTKFYYIGEGKAWSYNPKSQEAQEADLGKSKDLVNQFMLLAFGSNSAELKSAYSVKLGGPDVVNGENTTRLEMVPKSEEILKHVKRCDMWIAETGLTVQQKFFETGGDYVLATYSQVTLAPNLPESAVKLEIPKGIKVTKIK
ncbi:MAG TPA: outer membrane lipoprotein carrier protein LolA [Candidatus Acidoferrales bacterium]|nr:outer membrane lipoprotein carrier protein LolA [Candidatus Acidoferrales bacterium]